MASGDHSSASNNVSQRDDNSLAPTIRSSLRSGSRSEELKIVKSTPRSSTAMEELTINKLSVKSLGLIGREQEIDTLKQCFQRLNNEDSQENTTGVKNELVFIQGYSGIGKSKLARILQEDVDASTSGVYVEGKYEFTSIDEPYSGVSQAFAGLCKKFEDGPSEIHAKVSKEIRENMKEEAIMLTSLIPEVNIFLESNDDAVGLKVVDQGGTSSAGREHERWKYAFRMFIGIIGAYLSPIVMVLDDIQWADVSSLDVLDYLVSDVQNPHPLMIVGCYRSNEVDENSILYNRIRTLQEKVQKGIFGLTDIELQNCNADAVNKIIMSMMSIDDEPQTSELANLCFKRTLGNPFFVIEFMKMLQAECLIEFSLGLMKWGWDVATIEDATMSTENVVDLLKGRMKKLPEDVQLLLQYAGCLGSSFSAQILKYIWSQHACVKMVRATLDVNDMLDMIQDESLVESCGPDELRWVHDKVQEAALSLLGLATPSFKCDLGMFLSRGLDASQLESRLFDVADLANKGSDIGRVDVAILNLQAATKAQNMAALQSAAKYTDHAIKQLRDEEKWTLHRQLALQLYSLGAEMQYATGNIEKAEEYIDIVICREECTPMEKIPLKKMKAEILATAHLRWNEATDYGLGVLKDLGYKFAWNRALVPVQMLLAIKGIAKRLKKLSVADVENMEFMKDRKELAIVDILRSSRHFAYNANELPLCFLMACKVIEMTLDHGINECAADAFATFGGVLMFLSKDNEGASHACDLAFALQKRSGRRHIADTTQCAWAFVLIHIKPLHEGLRLTMDGYSQGLRDGDPFHSTNCQMHRFVILPYMMGRSLESITQELPNIAPQLEESGVANNILALRVWWQMMLNLQMAPSDDAKRLEGDQFSQSSEKAESNMYIANVNFAIGEVLCFFGDYEERAKRLLGGEKGKTYSELIQGYPGETIDAFHRGITWFEMARKTGKMKYKSEAKKIRKEITKRVEIGNPNLKDFDLVLRAEQAALDKKHERASDLYKEAIVYAARIGHLAHAALYNERYADYRLEVHNDADDFQYHMGEAIRYYTEWGAIGKVEQLERRMKKSD